MATLKCCGFPLLRKRILWMYVFIDRSSDQRTFKMNMLESRDELLNSSCTSNSKRGAMVQSWVSIKTSSLLVVHRILLSLSTWCLHRQLSVDLALGMSPKRLAYGGKPPSPTSRLPQRGRRGNAQTDKTPSSIWRIIGGEIYDHHFPRQPVISWTQSPLCPSHLTLPSPS